jgi:hypothetical protein
MVFSKHDKRRLSQWPSRGEPPSAAVSMPPGRQSPRQSQNERFLYRSLASTWQVQSPSEVRRPFCKPLVISSNLITGSPFLPLKSGGERNFQALPLVAHLAAHKRAVYGFKR